MFFCPKDSVTKTDWNASQVVGYSSYKALGGTAWYNTASTWVGYRSTQVPNNRVNNNTIPGNATRSPIMLEMVAPNWSGMIASIFNSQIDPTQTNTNDSVPHAYPHGSRTRGSLYSDMSVVKGYFAWNDPRYIGDSKNYRFTWPR